MPIFIEVWETEREEKKKKLQKAFGVLEKSFWSINIYFHKLNASHKQETSLDASHNKRLAHYVK